jgi:hypothetical protein
MAKRELVLYVSSRGRLTEGAPTSITKTIRAEKPSVGEDVDISDGGEYVLPVRRIINRPFRGDRVEIYFKRIAHSDLMDLLQNEINWTAV